MFVTSDPSDPDRLLVVERRGRIVLLDRGQSTFVDLTEPVESAGEQEQRACSRSRSPPTSRDRAPLRLLHPQRRRLVGDLQIDEFTACGDRRRDPSRRPVLTIDHSPPRQPQRRSAAVRSRRLPLHRHRRRREPAAIRSKNAQSTNSLLGKILRIDPRRSGLGSVLDPGRQPVRRPNAGADEIWSYGLRNPWRFSFDRADRRPADRRRRQARLGGDRPTRRPRSPAAGVNFGWDCREGRHRSSSRVPGSPAASPTRSSIPEPTCARHVRRSPAATSSATRAPRATSTAATSTPTSTPARFARWSRRFRPPRDRYEGRQRPARRARFGEDACGRVYVVSVARPRLPHLGDGSADSRRRRRPSRAAAGRAAGQSCAEAAGDDRRSPGPLEGTNGDDVIVGAPAGP